MALMIGRKPGQRVRIGKTTVMVVDVGDTVTVRIRPGGAFTFTTETEQLGLGSERAVVQARPHPHRERTGAAQLRITAPASVRIQRPERDTRRAGTIGGEGR